jgi:hypothetical protein
MNRLCSQIFVLTYFVAIVLAMIATESPAQTTNAPTAVAETNAPLLTRAYNINGARFYQLLTNNFPDTFVDHSPPPQDIHIYSSPGFQSVAIQQAVRQWVVSVQGPLARAKGVFYNDRTEKLLIRATETEHHNVEAALITNHIGSVGSPWPKPR